jgi:putative lipoic acid-binding regulatory protein
MTPPEEGPSPPESSGWWDRFQALLDDQNSWPAEYTFKFIVPAQRLDELKAVFGQIPLKTRTSRKGSYTSVTARVMMHSSDEVLALYTAAGAIEGVIAL